mmetsp:Transcript_39310/g.45886  ORF Transcript_39310/g.45886 Transcript_39310/m.45886 type:complete len:99 (-) Transcript_39310:66-362(-)
MHGITPVKKKHGGMLTKAPVVIWGTASHFSLCCVRHLSVNLVLLFDDSERLNDVLFTEKEKKPRVAVYVSKGNMVTNKVTKGARVPAILCEKSYHAYI